jgi:hypothetical protein
MMVRPIYLKVPLDMRNVIGVVPKNKGMKDKLGGVYINMTLGGIY